jgi:hypothetical protein
MQAAEEHCRGRIEQAHTTLSRFEETTVPLQQYLVERVAPLEKGSKIMEVGWMKSADA